MDHMDGILKTPSDVYIEALEHAGIAFGENQISEARYEGLKVQLWNNFVTHVDIIIADIEA